MYEHPPSSAFVKIVTAKNATFADSFQFDPPVSGVVPPTWTLYPNFRLDIKGYFEQVSPLLSLTSAAGQIVVDDAVQRVIHFNVPESILFPALVPGRYVYDLIMFSNDATPIRVALMHGEFVLTDGVTGG